MLKPVTRADETKATKRILIYRCKQCNELMGRNHRGERYCLFCNLSESYLNEPVIEVSNAQTSNPI